MRCRRVSQAESAARWRPTRPRHESRVELAEGHGGVRAEHVDRGVLRRREEHQVRLGLRQTKVGTAARLERPLLVLAYAYLLLLLIGLVCRDTMSEAHWASAASESQDQACGFTIGRRTQDRATWRLKTLLAAFARMLTEWVEENWG